MKLIIKDYFEALILVLCEFLRIENTFSSLFQGILILYSQLYTFSFIYDPIYNEQYNLRAININLSYFIRPYIFQQEGTPQFIILIILFILQHIVILIMVKLVLMSVENKKYYNFKFDDRLLLICTTYIYILSTLLYPILIEVSVLNFHNTTFAIIASCIMIFETLILIIFGDQLYTNGLVLYTNTVMYLNKCSLVYLVKLLKVLQIILFYILHTHQLAFMMQSTIVFIIQLLYLYILFENRIFVKEFIILLRLSLCSIGLVISFFTLITTKLYFNELWILLFLLLTKILYEKYQQPILDIEKSPIHILKYQFAYIERLDINQPRNQILLMHLIMTHHQTCKNPHGVCQLQLENKSKFLQIIQNRIELLLQNKNLNFESLSVDYITILIRNGELVKCQKVIFQLREAQQSGSRQFRVSKQVVISTIFKFLRKYVQRVMIVQMRDRKMFTSLSGQQTQFHFRQFAQNEVKSIHIQSTFKQLIIQKLELYANLFENEINNIPSLSELYKFVQKLVNFKHSLYERYYNYPTQSNQNIIKFYCAEILNDFIEAFNLNKANALDDEKYNLFSNSNYSRIFGLNPCYILAEMDQDSNIYAKRVSKQAKIFFNLISTSEQSTQSSKKQDLNLDISQFYPSYVKKIHTKLCNSFLDTGYNKFYQNQQLSFIQVDQFNDPYSMIPIDMMMGLNHLFQTNIQFYCFFYESDDKRTIIIVNKQNQIINCSQDIGDSLIDHKDNSILNILPEFDLYRDQQRVNNARVRLVHSSSQQSSSCYEYSAQLQIKKKFVKYDLQYFVVLDNLKKSFFQWSSSDFQLGEASTSQIYMKRSIEKRSKILQLSDTQEEIFKNIPYEYVNSPLNNVSIQQLQQYDSMVQLDQQEKTNEILLKTVQFQQLKSNVTFTQQERKVFSPINSVHQELLHFTESAKNKKSQHFFAHNNIETQSQMSTLTAIQKSKFYKKFETIYTLAHSIKQSSRIVFSNILFTIVIILSCIYSIILLVEISKMDNFIQDIKLLAIRCDVTEPLDSFLITRYTVVSYRTLLKEKDITQDEFNFLVIFPNSNMVEAYDILKERLYSVLEKPEINIITKDKEVAVYLYQTTNVGIVDNISFRTLASLLMNYQYEYKLALTVKTTQLDSAYFYFSFKNYLTVKQTFIDLNQEILTQSNYRVQQKSQKWLELFLPFLILVILINFLIYFQYFKFNQEQLYICNFLLRLDPFIIEQEKNRISLILQKFNDFDRVKDYKMEIDIIDHSIDSLKIKDSRLLKKQSDLYTIQNQSQYIGIVVQTITFVLYLAYSISLFFTITNYFEKYENTALFYFKIANLNSDVPTAFSQREVLYRRVPQYPFYTVDDIEGLIELFQNSVNSIEHYVGNYSKINYDKYLFDTETLDLLQHVYSNDLCHELSPEFEIKAKDICDLVMDGNLNLGLHQNLIDIVNTLRVEQIETQNFTILRTSKLQLEGVTLITNVLLTLKEKMYQNLLSTTSSLMQQQNILSYCFIITSVIVVYIQLKFVYNWNYYRYQYLKQLVYLFPRNTLMFDDQYYRAIRFYIKQEDL